MKKNLVVIRKFYPIGSIHIWTWFSHHQRFACFAEIWLTSRVRAKCVARNELWSLDGMVDRGSKHGIQNQTMFLKIFDLPFPSLHRYQELMDIITCLLYVRCQCPWLLIITSILFVIHSRLILFLKSIYQNH